MHPLKEIGWDDNLAEALRAIGKPDFVAARVVEEQRGIYRLWADAGELRGELAGKLRRRVDEGVTLPAVGDWVAVTVRPAEQVARIQVVLPRRSALRRKAPGRSIEAQVLAANVDTVFVVVPLNEPVNERRLERTLAMVAASGSEAVVLLTKADLCADLDGACADAGRAAPGIPVLALSAVLEGPASGLLPLEPWIVAPRTVVLIGPSGAGKSTLVNRLAGEALLAVGAIREDDGKGRHTTTHRQLVRLPQGGMLIDTPGLREVGLWAAGEDLDEAFGDIAELAGACRYRDCGHGSEADCAIQSALRSGALTEGRWASYHKLRDELERVSLAQQVRARASEKRSRARREWRNRDED